MKAKLRPTTKTFFSLAIAVSAFVQAPSVARGAQPHESGAGKVCGVLRSFEGETQIFDYTRTRLGDAAFGTKLHCGDWVSVDKGKATLEHVSGAGMLVAENSFVQILDPQSGENPEHAHAALYRGEFLAQPKGDFRVVTPNSVGQVAKGAAYVVYSALSEETQIVGLGGATTLQNRFFGEKQMVAGFAKVVTFANPVERLVPDQARYVSARDLNLRLSNLGVPAVVRETIEKAVKAGTKTKMPVTLAVTAKSEPKAVIRVQAEGELAGAHDSRPAPSRAPASFAKPVYTKVRPKPAKKADEPDFRLTRGNEEESEKRKLLQALSTMRPDESE